ncbi:hypothetical protein [Austwickia chelonae]|uniref:hypothetical protein n=1 Tax=Austwickia chelonae TaxID=100225 RepID=UPI0013C35D55|nr:hypothetical protein [Austwickia chelonae]
MSGSLELVVGEQSAAGAVIRASLPDLVKVLETFADDVEACASGFKGAAAAALSVELSEWVAAAADVIPALVEYAASLESVDRAAAQQEIAARTGVIEAGSSGASVSELNMW